MAEVEEGLEDCAFAGAVGSEEEGDWADGDVHPFADSLEILDRYVGDGHGSIPVA